MFRQWAVVVFAADSAAGVSAGVVAVVGGVDGCGVHATTAKSAIYAGNRPFIVTSL